jgi:hypothetical protein
MSSQGLQMQGAVRLNDPSVKLLWSVTIFLTERRLGLQ